MSTTELVATRDDKGRWIAGGPSPNPGGPKLQLVTTALRRLAEEIEETDAGPRTKAQMMADAIFARAMDPNVGALLASAHERWLKRDG
jgi:hypothetical protein